MVVGSWYPLGIGSTGFHRARMLSLPHYILHIRAQDPRKTQTCRRVSSGNGNFAEGDAQ